MLAIIRKEVRENLAWGLLGLGIVSLALYSGLSGEGFPKLVGLIGTSGRYGYDRSPLPLLSEALLTYTTVLYAILGGALGLLQTVPESRRGTWTTLFHLPVARGRLLLGKVAAGAAMYSVAGGVPLLVGVIWVAMPGHYAAPFRIAMAGAVFADFLCGLVFYLAGILTGVRRARWYGTRLAGFVFALVIMVFVQGSGSFVVAVLSEIAGGLILLWACYAVLQRRDS